MTKYFIHPLFLLLAAPVFLLCCTRNKASAPTFGVTAPGSTYKVGDTILFTIAGDPDMIIFYSGLPGAQYSERNRTSMAGVEKLVFQSSMQQGTLPDSDSMLLLISTNLQGYDSASVAAATWTDITSRNTKWPTTLTTAYTKSDSIDISDFNAADSVNIAFRFLGKSSPTSAQRKWEIENLALTNVLADGTVTPLFAAPFLGPAAPAGSAFAYTGWVEISMENNTSPGTAANGYVGYNAWNVGTAGVSTADSVHNSNGIPIVAVYPITFNPGPALNNPDNDDWLITTAVDLKTVKPDAGTPIKNIGNPPLKSYAYIVKMAGTFTMTFVATNSTAVDEQSVVRQLTITVTP